MGVRRAFWSDRRGSSVHKYVRLYPCALPCQNAQVREGMELLLVHVCAGDTAVPFSTFFEPQQTPAFLVSAGIYSASLAIPLHDGEHRKQSMALILRSLLSPPKQRRPPVAWHQIEREVNSARNSASGSDGVQVTCFCILGSLCHLPPPPHTNTPLWAFRRVGGVSFEHTVLSMSALHISHQLKKLKLSRN